MASAAHLKPIACNSETATINKAIVALAKAKQAETENELLAALQEAYKWSRAVLRGRLD